MTYNDVKTDEALPNDGIDAVCDEALAEAAAPFRVQMFHGESVPYVKAREAGTENSVVLVPAWTTPIFQVPGTANKWQTADGRPVEFVSEG